MRRTRIDTTPRADASKLTVGIAVADFNEEITGGLLAGAREALRAWGVPDDHVTIYHVYGSFDLTHAADRLLQQRCDAVIVLGCIVKGETDHDQYIATALFAGLTSLVLAYHRPVALGVLTTRTLAQARARSRGGSNHGTQAAIAAMRSALL